MAADAKTIALATFSRAEYGAALPILRAIKSEANLSLRLLVSGTHLLKEFGSSVNQIEEDGFEIADRIEMISSQAKSKDVGDAIAQGTLGFTKSFSKVRPDLLILLGDRYELLAAASAALPFRIPIAHVSGGDLTEGAFDNQIRFAISSLSHLHFVSLESHARRLKQVGEEPWRIHVTGEPSLDLLKNIKLTSKVELFKELGINPEKPLALVTLHPSTIGKSTTTHEIEALLKVLDKFNGNIVFTHPNADPGYEIIIERIKLFINSHSNSMLVLNLGQQKYFSVMATSDIIIGNSSSGILEAASFKVPVVNIGNRQKGREQSQNVINVEGNESSIREGIATAQTDNFKAICKKVNNLYGDGTASMKIVDQIKNLITDEKLLLKKFVDF